MKWQLKNGQTVTFNSNGTKISVPASQIQSVSSNHIHVANGTHHQLQGMSATNFWTTGLPPNEDIVLHKLKLNQVYEARQEALTEGYIEKTDRYLQVIAFPKSDDKGGYGYNDSIVVVPYSVKKGERKGTDYDLIELESLSEYYSLSVTETFKSFAKVENERTNKKSTSRKV